MAAATLNPKHRVHPTSLRRLECQTMTKELADGTTFSLGPKLSSKTAAHARLQVRCQNTVYIHSSLVLPALGSFLRKCVLRGDAESQVLRGHSILL